MPSLFIAPKVKLKKEIVTMGVENIDPLQSVGRYVKPSEWNALISDPEVILIDTRNDYEVQIGTFQNAVNPNTETFREFPEYVAKELDLRNIKKSPCSVPAASAVKIDSLYAWARFWRGVSFRRWDFKNI